MIKRRKVKPSHHFSSSVASHWVRSLLPRVLWNLPVRISSNISPTFIWLSNFIIQSMEALEFVQSKISTLEKPDTNDSGQVEQNTAWCVSKIHMFHLAASIAQVVRFGLLELKVAGSTPHTGNFFFFFFVSCIFFSHSFTSFLPFLITLCKISILLHNLLYAELYSTVNKVGLFF